MAVADATTCRIDVSTPGGPERHALVDADDFEVLSGSKWVFSASRNKVILSGAGDRAQMTRLILGFSRMQRIRHLNGDSLDCRKENLAFGVSPKRKVRHCELVGSQVRCLHLSGVDDGLFALVDEYVYDIARRWSWRLNHNGYVIRQQRDRISGKTKTLFLHRLVLPGEQSECIDHRDRDKLNNTRLNLREASKSENGFNMKGRASSGYKWAHFHKRRGQYEAVIRANNKVHRLGWFANAVDAHEACKSLARELHGEFLHSEHESAHGKQ